MDRSSSLVRFDTFEADLRSRELRKDGVKFRLGEQPFLVLTLLLAQPGNVVTREALQKTLWPEDTFVDSDRGLNKAINRLREALGDSADTPRFIETLPRRGYRFIGTIDQPAPPIERPPEAEVAPAQPLARPPRRIGSAPARAAAAAITVAAVVSVAWWWTPNRPAPVDGGPLIRSSLVPPPGRSFVPYSLALSGDGTHLAFVAEAADGSRSLWTRAMSATTATPIAGTDGANFPFWSPDLRHIGFFADRKLKAVDVAGGIVRVLGDAPRASGGTWNGDDVIVFAPDVNGPLYRVPAAGGTPAAVSRVPQGEGLHGHRWPTFLPNGELLYIAVTADAPSDNAPELRLGSLDTLEASRIDWNGERAAAYALGHLIYVRGGMLYAQPFDSGARRTTGPAIAISGAELAVAPAFFPSALAVSANGVLVFQAADDRPSGLTWLDAEGHAQGSLPVSYGGPALSPDGRWLAGSCEGARRGTLAICVFDLARGVGARITDGPVDRFPVWSPDGREIAYSAEASIHRVLSDGSRSPEFVSWHGTPTGWLPDGRILSFGGRNGGVSLALSSPVTHEVTEIGSGAEPQLSPDAAWLAFIGRDGLVVQRFPGGDSRVTVAASGANQPRWRHDGRRLFYIRSDKRLMAVDFDPIAATAGIAHAVAQTDIIGAGLVGFQYDVAADGRFVVNALTGSAAPLTLMSNWAPTSR